MLAGARAKAGILPIVHEILCSAGWPLCEMELGMELTAVLTPSEEGGFVALNPETGTTTQGDSIEEALANLSEATALYLEEFPRSIKGHRS